MTDYEILTQLTDTMNLFYVGFSAVTAIVFAYITAAYFFLCRAPLFVKLGSFIFFAVSVIFLVSNIYGGFRHYESIADQIFEYAADGGRSQVVMDVAAGMTRELAVVGVASFTVSLVGVFVMAFWMTFLWSPDERD